MEKLLSIIIPAYNEEANIPILYENICSIMNTESIPFECILIDDCSSDNTFAVAEVIAEKDIRIRIIRFARNSGSHIAIRCGLSHCCGQMAVVMAADMQDMPSLIPVLYKAVEAGSDIVWAIRAGREGESLMTKLLSRIFSWIMRYIVGLQYLPPTGSDFFCISRKVIDALAQFREQNLNIFALLYWLGFNQKQIEYVKQPRLHGISGWTLRKKLKMAVDSVVSFSFFPIRFLSLLGTITAIVGFLYALVIIFRNLFRSSPVMGWSSIMVAVLILGGAILVMIGILGEYIWRNLDEARARPLYVIDRTVNAISTSVNNQTSSVSNNYQC